MAPSKATTTWHSVTETALGELTLVRTADGLSGVYFPQHWYRPDPTAFGPRDDHGFDDAVAQLHEYLAGERCEFTLPRVCNGDRLQMQVWELVARIPYGETTSYGALAAGLGHDITAQQVGAAVGRNPLSIVVPCHRVVGSTGKLTGYAGGLARKRYLLDLESGLWSLTGADRR